jgi:hypothetical protein
MTENMNMNANVNVNVDMAMHMYQIFYHIHFKYIYIYTHFQTDKVKILNRRYIILFLTVMFTLFYYKSRKCEHV